MENFRVEYDTFRAKFMSSRDDSLSLTIVPLTTLLRPLIAHTYIERVQLFS